MKLTERSNGLYRWHAEKTAIGEMVWLMGRNPHYAQFQIISLRLFVEPPVLTSQFRIFYDDCRQAVGYVLWASVLPDLSTRISEELDFKLSLSEWNEGHDIWITDFFSYPGYTRSMVRELRKMFSSREVRYVRRWGNGRVSEARSRLRLT